VLRRTYQPGIRQKFRRRCRLRRSCLSEFGETSRGLRLLQVRWSAPPLVQSGEGRNSS